MGRRYRFESTINVSRDVLVAMLTSPEFLETEARESGATDVECRVRRRGSSKLTLVVRKTDPTLDGDGNPIEGRFDHVVMEQEWDLGAGRVDWKHSMEELEGMEVKGRNTITQDGPDSCRLVESGEITVKTGKPFIGWILDWWVAGQVIDALRVERNKRARYIAGRAKEGEKDRLRQSIEASRGRGHGKGKGGKDGRRG